MGYNQEVIQGIFVDKDSEDEFLIQKMTVHQRRIILMLLMKGNQLLSRKKMKKLNKNNKTLPMMSHKQNKKKALMILQGHKPNLPVVKKTSNHL